jgi:large subunit ribosomal protein L4
VKLDIFKIDGTLSGEKITMPSAIFEIEPNDHAIWLDITTIMTNRRHGNSSTKNRSAVRGGGRKPWRQKGRGTARTGTIRSPLWVGGGRIFGPSPRTFTQRIPKKISRLARKSALSYKAKDEKIRLIEDFKFEEPKTHQMVDILTQFKAEKTKTLLLVSENDRNIWLSGRNLPTMNVKEAVGFSTYDVVNADILLIQKGAIKKIKEVLGK